MIDVVLDYDESRNTMLQIKTQSVAQARQLAC